MLNLFVNGEGGLTTAGYALSAALLVLSILAGLALRNLYPIIYNYSYLLAEAAVTVLVIKIPAVEQALERVRKAAL